MRNYVARAAFTRGLDSVYYSRYKTALCVHNGSARWRIPCRRLPTAVRTDPDKHVCAVPLLALRLVDFRPASLFSLKPLASVFLFFVADFFSKLLALGLVYFGRLLSSGSKPPASVFVVVVADCFSKLSAMIRKSSMLRTLSRA